MATVKLTKVRSEIGRPKDQGATLRGLGLTKMHKTIEIEDTQSIRGMINKVYHLVRIED